FELACFRRARLTAVGEGAAWHAAVDAAEEQSPGVEVERLPLSKALPQLMSAADRFCVVVTQQAYAETVSDLAAYGSDGSRVLASGRLSQTGPGVFGPTHGSAPDIAGQGVANPTGMLLAAALLLSEGLGERAAGKTLERAMTGALSAGARTADLA